MRITLRQLTVFRAICQVGGVNAAAASVGLSQSAMSQALSELESSLDGPLFDRVGRRLQLNERGRALLPRALELLERAEDIEGALRDTEERIEPRLVVCASLTVGSYFLPPYLTAYLASHPRARVHLQVENTQRVIDAVAAFEVDVGFIEGSCAHPDLLVHPWRNDELAIVAAPGHPLARRRTLRPRDLQDAEWVLRERGSGTREVFDAMLRHHGVQVTPRLEMGHTEAVIRAVSAGAGLSCLSRAAVEDAVQNATLLILPCAFLDLHRPLHAVLHREKFVSPALRALLRACEVSIQRDSRAQTARTRPADA